MNKSSINKDLLALPEKAGAVVKPGEFCFAAIGLAHGHIYIMCRGLMAAGATLKYIYDDNPELIDAFLRQIPGVRVAESEQEILSDSEVKLVASADIPSKRCPLGIRVMESGKDYLADKAPLVSLEQLDLARAAVKRTGRKYAVYYGERLGCESGVFAGTLIERGAIGRVVNVLGLGPHKLNNGEKRGEWFYKRETQGGILIDIGSHQIEQFLYYTKNTRAAVTSARIANFAHKQYPEFDDFGDCNLIGENGATGYFRVDWFTPQGVKTFGDGRTVICGTDGYIELRKYTDIGVSDGKDNLIIATNDGVEKICVEGKIGLPYFGELILDCINRTENAMTQEHAFYSAELSIMAQRAAFDCERT